MPMDIEEIRKEYVRLKSYDISTFKAEPENLSVIIITKNEEKNIARCLKSVQFADEIIMVDSGSTDNTLQIAAQFEKVKIIPATWEGFVKNKLKALAHVTNQWVLWVDADEEVTPELAAEWEKRRQESFHKTAAIDVPRKTFFLGHWVKYSGWYPGRVLRFFHVKRAFFSDNILHESVQAKEGYITEQFQSHLLHYSYTSLYQYFDKMNKYGIYGAYEALRKNKRVFVPRVFFQFFWTFFRFYILKKGFLDGKIGFIICMGAAFSNFIKYANFIFLKKYGYVDEDQPK